MAIKQLSPQQKRRNSVIGAVLWAATTVLGFFSITAFMSMANRIYVAFAVNVGRVSYYDYMGSVAIRQFLLIPLGFLAVIAIIGGAEVLYKFGGTHPEKVWRFYSVILGIELAVLILALKV
ncbi:MAG: hypothetical protein JW750_06815 [Anaerolineaceae bacterium]|nr:hypothetical protein [Anaerolineaceae bacterium]